MDLGVQDYARPVTLPPRPRSCRAVARVLTQLIVSIDNFMG